MDPVIGRATSDANQAVNVSGNIADLESAYWLVDLISALGHPLQADPGRRRYGSGDVELTSAVSEP